MSSAFSAKTRRREVQSKTSIHYMQLCPQINCKFWIGSWAIKTPNAAKFMAPNKVETRLLLLCVSLQLELRFISAIYTKLAVRTYVLSALRVISPHMSYVYQGVSTAHPTICMAIR